MINTEYWTLSHSIPYPGLEGAPGQEILSAAGKAHQWTWKLFENTVDKIAETLRSHPKKQQIDLAADIIETQLGKAHPPLSLLEGYAQNVQTAVRQRFLQRTGIEWDAFVQVAPISSKVIRQYFYENPDDPKTLKHKVLQFAPTPSIEKQIQQYAPLLHSGYKSFGMKSDDQTVVFSPEDLQALGRRTSKVVCARTLNCLQYALLKRRDPHIQDPDLFFELTVREHTPQLLAKLGYIPVPSPQPNDLVVYYTKSTAGSYCPGHVGLWTESGEVHSKCGTWMPYTYTHSLFTVPPHYGQYILFLRKNPLSCKECTIQ